MEPVPDEHQWVARFQAGDASAFEKIMNRYESYVLGLLWRVTGDRAKAEDLCQETFLKVLRGLPSFRGESSLKTWIFRIAHNALRDQLRSTPAEESLAAEEDAPAIDPQDPSPGPLQRVSERQLRQAVEGAMGRLPQIQREVLHLLYWDGLSISEIASALRLPEGTVKTHLFRGRKALRGRVAHLVVGGLA